jgi:hypothetical protein
VLVLATRVSAHPLSPALLELRELGAGQVEVTWRRSILKLPGADETRPVLPAGCVASAPERTTEDDEAITATWSADCGTGGLVGTRLAIEGLGRAMSDALIRVTLADGRTLRAVVNERDPSFTVPARESKAAVVRSYASLGVHHILSGIDHLLFIFGLLLLVPSRRLLLATITAFTIGHSVTLSFAALGVTDVPVAPVEVLIALSIYVLAVDLAREHPTNDTLLRRRPWLVALLFGLLHGMGFAGALKEVGLPQEEIPLALFSFNGGIEAGQLAFVAGVLAVRYAVRPVVAVLPVWFRRVPVYAMGSLAVFWMFERAAL